MKLIICLLTCVISLSSGWKCGVEVDALSRETEFLKKVYDSCPFSKESSNCLAAKADYQIFKLSQLCNFAQEGAPSPACLPAHDAFLEFINHLSREGYTETAIDKLKKADKELVRPEKGLIAISKKSVYDKLCTLYALKGELFFYDASLYCCEFAFPLCNEVRR